MPITKNNLIIVKNMTQNYFKLNLFRVLYYFHFINDETRMWHFHCMFIYVLLPFTITKRIMNVKIVKSECNWSSKTTNIDYRWAMTTWPYAVNAPTTHDLIFGDLVKDEFRVDNAPKELCIVPFIHYADIMLQLGFARGLLASLRHVLIIFTFQT